MFSGWHYIGAGSRGAQAPQFFLIGGTTLEAVVCVHKFQLCLVFTHYTPIHLDYISTCEISDEEKMEPVCLNGYG